MAHGAHARGSGRFVWSIGRRVGFPFLSAEGEELATLVLGGAFTHSQQWLVGALPAGFHTRDLAGRTPVRPLWMGVLGNTLFYAALLWLLFLVVTGRARRYFRARRGLCPTCGYPGGETAVCSECGEPVRSRRPSAT